MICARAVVVKNIRSVTENNNDMRVFVTASFGDDKENTNNLCAVVKAAGFEDFCFVRDVENFEKKFSDTKKLMQQAKEDIEKSDALLIDMSDKPTGRAIEAGIAYALGKKIIVVMKKGTVIKDTTRGIADFIIEYEKIGDILTDLVNIKL